MNLPTDIFLSMTISLIFCSIFFSQSSNLRHEVGCSCISQFIQHPSHKNCFLLISGKFDESVKKIFKELDTDGSGKVNAKELTAMLKEMGSKLDQIAVERLIKKFDLNKDGELSIDELDKLLEF